jgi:glycosyl hydrolase family 47
MLNGELEPEMPSFVLSETFKYLYLLYDNVGDDCWL